MEEKKFVNIEDSLFKTTRLRKELQEKNKRIYQEESKKKLKKNVEKKMKTTFIGAIDKIEKKFGHLWAKNQKDLNSSERLWRGLWEELRKEILDQGNNQLRAALSEIDEYQIEWNKYHIEFNSLGKGK